MDIFYLNIIKHSRSWIKLEKSWRIIKISFRFLNKPKKNHEQILFNLTKFIYTHASGHVKFWDFKLVSLGFWGGSSTATTQRKRHPLLKSTYVLHTTNV